MDPSILNDFHQGTWRALHTCIPKFVNVENGDKTVKSYEFSSILRVTSMLNDPNIYNGMLEGMLRNEIKCEQLVYNEEVSARIYK